MQHQKENFIWANDLRSLATIAVILLHATSPILLNKSGAISNSTWWEANIIDGTVRFCVPIFLMLTGALLLQRTYQLKDFLRTRMSRILYPFIFWSLIYILSTVIMNRQNGQQMSAYELIRVVFFEFRHGASYHLWYIYLIIFIYLIFPILSKWIVSSSEKEISFYLGIWVAALILNFTCISKYDRNINLDYFLCFIGFPVLGYLLSVRSPGARIKLYSFFLCFAGLFITILGTYLLSKRNGRFYYGLYSFLSPNVIMLASGLFLFFRFTDSKKNIFSRASAYISRYSYGIYLSHVFVLRILARGGISWAFINPLIGIPLTTILCLAFSLLITISINKFPGGKYVSG